MQKGHEPLPNPFPQLGTPTEKIRIKPVGYEREIEEIRSFVLTNIGKQPLMINIYGEYGQGKTTFLKFLEDKFSGSDSDSWADFLVDSLDISKFPPLEDFLLEKQKEAEEKGKKGIIIILDEMQHVSTEGGLTQEQEDFMNSLRRFADDNIPGLRNSLFTLVLAMHPETEKFLKDHGYYDVEQRRGTFKLVLRDLDYFTAHEMVNEYFKEMHKIDESVKPSFEEYFDEAFINAFYILSQDVESAVNGIRRLNGRTFAQIFFVLFEEYNRKGSKLEFEDLKSILLGDISLKFRDYPLKIDLETYFDILKFADSEQLKEIVNKFLFNPKWHFEEKEEKTWLKILSDRGILSLRECIIVDPDEITKYSKMDRTRIYLEGEKWLVFTDFLTPEQKKTLLEHHEEKRVYRLSEEYLDTIYGFVDEDGEYKGTLREYFKLTPSERVDRVLQKIIENMDGFNITTCKQGPSYKFAEGAYNVLGKIKYNVGIFYYAEKYNKDEFKEYLDNVIKNIENSEHDFVLVLVCPYYRGKLPTRENLEIRKMENRLFIENLSSESLGEILEDNLEEFEDIIRESMKIYVKEAIEKGFTLPLTGFKEKINNKPSLFRDKFIDEISKAWKIELQDLEPMESEILSPSASAIDGNGKLINLARNSLKEFIKVDENDKIRGCMFSKYENRFLELLDIRKDEVNKNEIDSAMKRYFSSFSRFPVSDFITRILEKKNILEIHSDFYKIKKPEDYLQKIIDIMNRGSLATLISRNDLITHEKISSLKIILDELKEKSSSELTWQEVGTYNTKLDSIVRFLDERAEPLQDIKTDLNLLKEDLDKKFLDISMSDIEFSEIPEDSFINKYFSEREKFTIEFDSFIDFINKEIKEPFNLNQGLLKDIKSILRSIVEIDSSYESVVNHLFEKLGNLENDMKNPKIENLMTDDYSHSYSSNQLNKAKTILKDVNQFIENYIKSMETLNQIYPELKDTVDYIESHSDYIEDQKIDLEEENARIKRLAKKEFMLCEPYVHYILKEYKDLKNKIDVVIENEKLHEFFRTLDIPENIPQNNLENLVKEKKESSNEFKHISTEELIKQFLRAGFIKKITITTEYYKDGDYCREKFEEYENNIK